jgi:hypothetical protein
MVSSNRFAGLKWIAAARKFGEVVNLGGEFLAE